MRTASNASKSETQRARERTSRMMSRARSGACLASGAFAPGWAGTSPTPAALRTFVNILERRRWGSFAFLGLRDGDATEHRARRGRGGECAFAVVDHRVATLVTRSGGGGCSLRARGGRPRGRCCGSSWYGLWCAAAIPVAEVGRAVARVRSGRVEARVAPGTGTGRPLRRLQGLQETIASGPSGLSGLGLGGLSRCPGRGVGTVVARGATIRFTASTAPEVWCR